MATKKPLPEDYGLSGDIQKMERELEAKSASEDRKRIGKYLLLNLLISGALIAAGWNQNSNSLGVAAVIGMSSICIIGFFQLLAFLFADGKTFLQSDKTYQTIQQYKRDLGQYYHYRNLAKLSYWDSLDGHQFEHAFADVCRQNGYSATVSKAGGDGGVDLILKKDGRVIVVQCKAHKKKIGPAPVRDLYGVMASNGYKEGWVVSKNGFSDNAVSFARGKPIRLIDIQDVIMLAGKSFYDRYGLDDEDEQKPSPKEKPAKNVIETAKVEQIRTTSEVQTAEVESISVENVSQNRDRYSTQKAELKNDEVKKQATKSASEQKPIPLDEAAYLKARSNYKRIILKCLVLCAVCGVLVLCCYKANIAWAGIAIIPGILAIPFSLFTVWVSKPGKDNPSSYKDEKEWLLQNDERYMSNSTEAVNSKKALDEKAYIEARNKVIKKLLIATSVLVALCFIIQLGSNTGKWYFVAAYLPAVWCFVYIVLLFFSWPERDKPSSYKDEKK